MRRRTLVGVGLVAGRGGCLPRDGLDGHRRDGEVADHGERHEHSCTGRVLEFDPASRRVRTVMRDLCFANGVALSADERSLLVVETGQYRVWTVDVASSNLSAKADRLDIQSLHAPSLGWVPNPAR